MMFVKKITEQFRSMDKEKFNQWLVLFCLACCRLRVPMRGTPHIIANKMGLLVFKCLCMYLL